MGRFFLTQMVAVAELEAGLVSERTKAALTAAKRLGTNTVISIVGREFGSRGVRTGVSIRHGTPRRRRAACSPEETQISRIGETTPSGPMSTDPNATGSGTVDPTSQGWPTAPASLPEGPGFNDVLH
jgi:hypothetical protein